MSKFIGARMTDALPMTRGAYNLYRKWIIPADENPTDEGYLVTDLNGYVNWSPKERFDRQNFCIYSDHNTISEEDIEEMIDTTHVSTIAIPGHPAKVTIVVCTLVNGFTITESSACVDPRKYSKELGTEICIKKIKEKIWLLLGFLLQSGLNGFKGDNYHV